MELGPGRGKRGWEGKPRRKVGLGNVMWILLEARN